jgi:hypothetical protein
MFVKSLQLTRAKRCVCEGSLRTPYVSQGKSSSHQTLKQGPLASGRVDWEMLGTWMDLD